MKLIDLVKTTWKKALLQSDDVSSVDYDETISEAELIERKAKALDWLMDVHKNFEIKTEWHSLLVNPTLEAIEVAMSQEAEGPQT